MASFFVMTGSANGGSSVRDASPSASLYFQAADLWPSRPPAAPFGGFAMPSQLYAQTTGSWRAVMTNLHDGAESYFPAPTEFVRISSDTTWKGYCCSSTSVEFQFIAPPVTGYWYVIQPS